MPQVNEFSWIFSSLIFLVSMTLVILWLNFSHEFAIFYLNSSNKTFYRIV